MTIEQYIAEQLPERKALLSSINKLILKTNKKVTPEIAKMMGTTMIQYKIKGLFVYALGSQKNHISLHLLPMYMHKPIHEKYSNILKKAKVQKGCINFKNENEMPLDIVEQVLTDCAKVDIEAIMMNYKKSK